MNPRGMTVALAFTLAAGTARADWPSARQSEKRLASTTGKSNIDQPAAYWRFFHGGTIGATGAAAVDVDGDGKPEAILASGGSLVAERPDNGDTVWRNDALDFPEIDGLADLDGDGVKELVAHTSGRLFVLRVRDGSILWAEPVGEMGTISGVRLGDLSGDGIDDAVVYECGCCAINSGNSAVVYSFAGAGANIAQPRALWTPPKSYCGSAPSATIVHMRGPKVADLSYGAPDHLQLLDGKTGVVVAEMPPFGANVQASRCAPVDVDGDGTEELLCVLVDPSGVPNNGRRLYLVRYLVNPAPQLKVVWQQLVGVENGTVKVPPAMVADLDGDGQLEAVAAGKNSAGGWTTYVYDAKSGNLRASLDDRLVDGFAPILAGGQNALIAGKGSDLFAWRLQGGSLQPLWTIPKRRPVASADVLAAKRSSFGGGLLVFDHDGDGVGELATVSDTADKLVLVRAAGGSPQDVASYALPAGVGELQAWSFVVAGVPRLAIAQSDGNFHLLDAQLAPVSGNPAFGARFGGFFASSQFRQLTSFPLVANLGDATPGLLAVTSREALVRLDATQASFADPPKVMWSRDHTIAPHVLPKLFSGAPGIVAVEHKGGSDDIVVAVAADGTTRWTRPIKGAVLADVGSGNLNGDGVPDVIVEHGDLGDLVDLLSAISGADGSVLWNASFGPNNRQPAGGAVADWNGDGIDDYVFQFAATYVVDGKSGKLLQQSAAGGPYYMPMLRDVNGDGLLDATLYAGVTGPATIAHDLANYVWQGDDALRPLTYGALHDCPGAPVLLGGSWSTPPLLTRVVAGGSAAGMASTQLLAGGASYPDFKTAAAAGATMRQLGSPSVHANLAGDGAAIAVIGSGDGWIYGIEACSGKFRFAAPMTGPVGAIALGDTNGDGLDEIIASVADGYLYALRRSFVPPVANVADTDPPHGIVSADVDDIDTHDTLYAAWPPAPGVDGYEVAVVRDAIDGGGFLTTWLDQGNHTSATMDKLAIEDGKRYFVAVRAIKAGERSPDTLSDGVTVHLVAAPEAAPPTGTVWLTGRSCLYCAAARPSDSLHDLWGPGLALLLALRRRLLPRPRAGKVPRP